MKKRLSSFLITALWLLLLVYSGARSLDFISQTLPENQKILAIFGLAALDIGLVFWLLNYLYGSHGYQRVIALIMVVVDFLGVFVMFTLDTLLNTGFSGMTAKLTPEQIQAAVIGLGIVIALNIGSTIMHHILDPENLRRTAEEEARDRIEELALKSMMQNAAQMAPEIASQMGKLWREEELAKYQTSMRGRKKALPENVTVFESAAKLPEKIEDLPENPTRPAKGRGSKKS